MRLCRKCGDILYGGQCMNAHPQFKNIDSSDKQMIEDIKELGWQEIVVRYHPGMFNRETKEKKIAKEKFNKYKSLYEGMKKRGEVA